MHRNSNYYNDFSYFELLLLNTLLLFWTQLSCRHKHSSWPLDPVESPVPRLKVLWLTLCQPHNAVEIEVRAFLTSPSNMSDLTVAVLQTFHFFNCFFPSPLSICPFTPHPRRSGKTPPCLPTTSGRSWPSQWGWLLQSYTHWVNTDTQARVVHTHLFSLRPDRALQLPLIDLSFEDRDISMSRGEVQIFDPSSLLEFNRLACRLGWVQGDQADWADRSDRVWKRREWASDSGSWDFVIRQKKHWHLEAAGWKDCNFFFNAVLQVLGFLS